MTAESTRRQPVALGVVTVLVLVGFSVFQILVAVDKLAVRNLDRLMAWLLLVLVGISLLGCAVLVLRVLRGTARTGTTPAKLVTLVSGMPVFALVPTGVCGGFPAFVAAFVYMLVMPGMIIHVGRRFVSVGG